MEVTGWPNNVNNKILIETTITEGDGGTAEDSMSNGFKARRATSLVTPRKYNVKMDFDWGGAGSEFQFPVDEHGLTEYDRFIRWYKFQHQKGTRPFWFPCITKDSIDNLQPSDKSGMCLYQITSSLQEQVSGYSMSITMTWEEIYSGILTIPAQSYELKSVVGKNGKATVTFTDIPSTVPLPTDFTVTCVINNDLIRELPISSVTGKNDTASLKFETVVFTGEAEVTIKYKDKSQSYKIYS